MIHIPAARALIGWRYQLVENHLLVYDVVVLDQQIVLDPDSVEHSLWAECHPTAGACMLGWAEQPAPVDIFAQMCVSGFTNNAELLRAVREFSKIDTCDWARRAFATRN